MERNDDPRAAWLEQLCSTEAPTSRWTIVPIEPGSKTHEMRKDGWAVFPVSRVDRETLDKHIPNPFPDDHGDE